MAKHLQHFGMVHLAIIAAALLLNVALALEYEAKCMQAEHRLAAGLTATEAGV
jgi:hypothetical protein